MLLNRVYVSAMMLLMVMSGCTRWPEPTGWLQATDYEQVHVVVGAVAPPVENRAARQFAEYWRRTTGFTASVASEPDPAKVNVWVGRQGMSAALLGELNLEGIAPDGIHIKTVTRGPYGRPSLLLAGGADRGTLNAVYRFFERQMGVRWLTPTETYIPATAPQSLPMIDLRYDPVFEYRWSGNAMGRGEELEHFMEVHGLKVAPIGSNGHNLLSLAPPATYYETHPEYFALIDGERMAPIQPEAEWRSKQLYDRYAQLCMSNPEVADVIMRTLSGWIEERPEIPIWGVMQEDNFRACQCAECQALDEVEGSPMGSFLTGVNRVADQLALRYPDKRLITYAYIYTRRPPERIEPRDNVIIQLCSIECDASRPLTDPNSRENAVFANEVREWAQISDQLYLYDYVPNYTAWFRPHPNLHVIQPNLKFFAENNVRAVFVSGCSEPKGEFTALRSYLIAKALWDPNVDGSEVIDEFVDLYYRETAPWVKKYIKLLETTARRNGAVMTCYDPGWWIDYEMCVTGRQMLEEAMAAAGSEEVRERVHLLYLSILYASMKCPPKVEYQGDRIVLERPPAPSVKEMLGMLEAAGVEQVDESTWLTGDLAAHFDGSFEEPRNESSPIVTLENDEYLVWIAPELKGSVLRWRDKRRGLELLKGFERYQAGPGTWQDWVNTPGVKEGPPADRYEVVESGPTRVHLRATIGAGLIIERVMELNAEAAGLNIKLTLHNPLDHAVEANIKIHPEFSTLTNQVPEIWLGSPEDWTWANEGIRAGERSHGSFSHGEYLEAGDYDRIAYRIPAKDLTMTCRFNPDQIGSLLWYFDVSDSARQVNLELIPPSKPLEPGDTRVIEASYMTRSNW